MTTPQTDPVLTPLVQATTGYERAVLEAFLDFNRCVIARKAHGLSDAASRSRLVPSSTSLAGIVKHLTQVETNWFRRVLTRQLPQLPDDVDREATFLVDDAETISDLLEGYERACAASRQAAAGYTLDDVATHPQLGTISLRWIYVHMIQETARHAGHADILRELTDGTTGLTGAP